MTRNANDAGPLFDFYFGDQRCQCSDCSCGGFVPESFAPPITKVNRDKLSVADLGMRDFDLSDLVGVENGVINSDEMWFFHLSIRFFDDIRRLT
jgi:hypothetical protein